MDPMGKNSGKTPNVSQFCGKKSKKKHPKNIPTRKSSRLSWTQNQIFVQLISNKRGCKCWLPFFKHDISEKKRHTTLSWEHSHCCLCDSLCQLCFMVVVNNNRLFFLGWCSAPNSAGETPSQKNRPLGVSVGPLDRIAAHVICRSRGGNGPFFGWIFSGICHPGAFCEEQKHTPIGSMYGISTYI